MLFRKKKNRVTPFCSVVVAAAGASTRMEGADKMAALVDGIPVLARTLMALEACPLVDEIILVTQSERIPWAGQLCRDFNIHKAAKVVTGGDTRTRSVLHGVNECARQAELVAIHDGARPFVTEILLRAVIEKAALTGAAAPAVPVKDTIKRAENGLVTDTPERSSLFAVQTPQVFEASLIRGALIQAEKDAVAVTDDCAAVERLGMKVTLTEGSDENIKITTPVDLALAEAILAWRGAR